MRVKVYFTETNQISTFCEWNFARTVHMPESGKFSCNWLIMLVSMATPISSYIHEWYKK